jgi:hypothetical protein
LAEALHDLAAELRGDGDHGQREEDARGRIVGAAGGGENGKDVAHQAILLTARAGAPAQALRKSLAGSATG